MRTLTMLFFAGLICLTAGCDTPAPTPTSTYQADLPELYTFTFHLNEHTTVDRVMSIYTDSLVFFNHTERIALPFTQDDYFEAHFALYNSAIRLNPGLDSGYWEVFDRDTPYRVPITVQAAQRFKKPKHRVAPDTLKYAVHFNPETDNRYPAVGTFLHSNRYMSGTFLTETGDFRFLQGRLTTDSTAELSCFDGSHLFHFAMSFSNDSMHGTFTSGLHYSAPFRGTNDHNAQLADPFQLTTVINDNPIELKVLNEDGESVRIDSHTFEGKITLLQVMGTWCPNCVDESRYLRELHDRLQQPKLQIIGIAYERGNDLASALPRLARYREKLALPYPVYAAGPASKAIASEQFSMLSGITSFPTTIVVGPDARIRLVHTGFNGPGTGEVYHSFAACFESHIDQLVNELNRLSVR